MSGVPSQSRGTDNPPPPDALADGVPGSQSAMAGAALPSISSRSLRFDRRPGTDERIELGRGGFGRVYAGQYDNQPVAIKVLRSGGVDETTLCKEAALLAGLRHDNILRLYGVCRRDGDELCIVVERASPWHAGQFAKEQIRLGVPAVERAAFVVEIGASVADALGYLHNLRPCIIHDDIKAGNVLLMVCESGSGFCKAYTFRPWYC